MQGKNNLALANILIIGGDSKIGTALYKRLINKNSIVWKTTRKKSIEQNEFYFNLEDEILDSSFPKIKFDFVFMCASITSLDFCNKFPELSHKVNVVSTLEILKYFIKNESFIIFFSTNLVFDGLKPNRSIAETLNPCTEYGKQKFLVENELSKLPNNAIFRLTKVIDYSFKLFDNWIEDLTNLNTISPFYDMKMSPVWIDYLIEFLLEYLEKPEKGVFHVSASDEITYCEAAKYIVRKLRLDKNKVVPISAKTVNIEHIPNFTSLSTKNSSLFKFKDISSFRTIDSFLSSKMGTNL